MRNDDSYEAYKRKFNLGVVGVIILMLVLWFGNFDGLVLCQDLVQVKMRNFSPF